ncbi:hypothetical protein THIOM_002659 [Candidatus Thiomargarita nelsonii]|uniref:Uncharacterized protein n=1 Tax=Candidatus Thiomargarita nelsonii TaxID=1003181 RepID=A0A176S0V2_9GAMM|nr:hypothetical protein THIOM_002659 [Candidatus Thiomargarita nelsonii]
MRPTHPHFTHKEELMTMIKQRNDRAAVIFLDIDGVIQPLNNSERFEHDLVKLKEKLAHQYNNDEYLEMDQYDLGAVYYDWDKEAVERLRKLCVDVPAEIVIISDWRGYSPLPRLKDYFRLHDLDQYLVGEIPQLPGKFRCEEVTEYLTNNSDIQNFVILDDANVSDFEENYPEHFVYCSHIFSDESYQKALRILS